MALDQTRSNEILTHLHGGTAFPTITGLIRVRLYTAVGNATTTGTEVATGGGYTSGNNGGATIATWAAAASGSQATSAAVSFTNYPRAETVTSIELWDSTATNKRLEFGTLTTSRTMAAGDTLSFASGAITSALA
jgi:hypothetical protein